MTAVYTFHVAMTVQVLAENDEQARQQLDAQGGYLSERTVEFIAVTDLPAAGGA